MYPVRCVFRLVSYSDVHADLAAGQHKVLSTSDSNDVSVDGTGIIPEKKDSARRNISNANNVCRLMVSAPKRNHKKAVSRNLFKRRLREAFRLNRGELIDQLTIMINNTHNRVELHMSLSYVAKEELDYIRIENAVKRCLEKVAKKISCNASDRID